MWLLDLLKPCGYQLDDGRAEKWKEPLSLMTSLSLSQPALKLTLSQDFLLSARIHFYIVCQMWADFLVVATEGILTYRICIHTHTQSNIYLMLALYTTFNLSNIFAKPILLSPFHRWEIKALKSNCLAQDYSSIMWSGSDTHPSPRKNSLTDRPN